MILPEAKSPAPFARAEGGAAGASPAKPNPCLPIGIFDSGVGGLTVLCALHRRLPEEHLIYLGDTARLPYGTKSSDTIVRYALQSTEKLVERNIKLLVVACNTATAAALPALQKAYPHLPVVGVVEPGARAACDASPEGHILVLATESTIRNQAYTKAIQAIRPDAVVTGVPCSLLVSLAEEGWLDGPIAEAVAARYLAPFTGSRSERPDCIVLGCTHFPPLAKAIRAVAGQGVALVDSAETTAGAVRSLLGDLGLIRPSGNACGIDPAAVMSGAIAGGRLHFMTTDAPDRFARVGSLFMGVTLAPELVELVSL